MTFARSVAAFVVLSLPLVVAPASVRAADDGAAARSWQVPAAMAAEAAASASAQSAAAPAKDAPAPPQPVAAVKPETVAATAAAATSKDEASPGENDAAPAANVPPVAASPAADAKVDDAKATDAKPEDTKSADTTSKDTKGKDAKGKEAKPKKPVIPAKQLFGSVKTPAPLIARSIGWYAKGCLAGAKPLAVDGPAWQVMRLSRNRMWGHPELIDLIERFANDVKKNNEWPGLLVGDISQPRGGPMLTGHASHQVGLDADIWFTPMPDHTLTNKEREDISATSMLAAGDLKVDPKVWGEGQVKLVKRAASYARVERVLVHPAIKKALCEAAGTDRAWLSKVRPYWGHYYHFHIRISCPKGSSICKAQPPPPGDDGCGAEVTDWLKKIESQKKKQPTEPVAKPEKPEPKKPEIALSDLPSECQAVLASGGNKIPTTPIVVEDNSKDAAPPPKVADDAAAQPVPTSTPATAAVVPEPAKKPAGQTLQKTAADKK